jgi:hypothetical protein
MMTSRTAVNIDVFRIKMKVAAEFGDAKQGNSRTIPGKDAGDLKISAEPKNGYLR